MIDLYNRITQNCKSINMLNMVHIKLENYMTPEQFVLLKNSLRISELPVKQDLISVAKKILKKNIKNTIPGFYNRLSLGKKEMVLSFKSGHPVQTMPQNQTITWIQDLDSYFSKIKKVNPEPYIKKRIDRYTYLFTSKYFKHVPNSKTLLVCFTGNANRMMMPVCVFLQNLNAQNTDVIFLKDPGKNGYRHGVAGYDNSFVDMLDRLSSLPFKNYKRVIGLGTSGGGIPVLLMSLKYEFDAVMAVSARSPNDVGYIKALGKEMKCFVRDVSKNTQKIPRIYLVYGANSSVDKDFAYLWKEILPASILKETENAPHNALLPLIKNGQFADFLSQTIFNVDQTNTITEKI